MQIKSPREADALAKLLRRSAACTVTATVFVPPATPEEPPAPADPPCRCTYAVPCKTTCTCAFVYMSGGCDCCHNYGKKN